MKIEEIKNTLVNAGVEIGVWQQWPQIDSIIFKNGTGLYPDWKHLYFLLTENGRILVRHGTVEPYGGRLPLEFSYSRFSNTVIFPREYSYIPDTEFYENIKFPEAGSVVRASEGNKVLFEGFVTKVERNLSGVVIHLDRVLDLPMPFKLSFYDPIKRQPLSIHSTKFEGIYMNFIVNKGKAKKKFGIFHQEFRIKDIQQINLKLDTISKRLFKIETNGGNYGDK